MSVRTDHGTPPDPVSVQILPGLRTVFTLHLEPAATEWQILTSTAGHCQFRSGDYLLDIALDATGAQAIAYLKLRRADSHAFTVKRYSAKISFPLLDVGKVWHGSVRPGDTVNVVLPWRTQVRSSAQNGMPYIAAYNRAGVNRVAVGFENQVLESDIRGHFIDQQEGVYQFEIDRLPTNASVTRHEWQDALFLSRKESSWFDVVRDYADWVDRRRGYIQNPPPPGADDPTWCSWFCHMDDINEEVIWDNASRAAALGVKTILIDAGWFAPTGRWGALDTRAGDWVPDANKFPDLRMFVNKLQVELNVIVQLWCAPFWLGTASKKYEGLKDALVIPPGTRRVAGTEFLGSLAEGANQAWREELAHGLGIVPEVYLCPRHPATREHVAWVMQHLLDDYGVDGLWFDFIDTVPTECQATHDHVFETMGEGVDACIAAMFKAAREAKPTVLFELKQGYGNLNNKRHCNALQSSSGAHDADKVRRLTILQRSWGSGVLIKSGTPVWHLSEGTAAVGKYMAAAITAGAPSFCLDFRKLPVEHVEVVRAWLSFYREHKKALLSGRLTTLSVVGELYLDVLIEGEDRLFFFQNSSSAADVTLSHGVQRIFIANGCYSDRLLIRLGGVLDGRYETTSRDPQLQEVSREVFHAAGERLLLDVSVPEGGLLEVRREHER